MTAPQAPGAPARILIVDDQPLMRRGLGRLLSSEEGIRVVGEAKDGQAALDLLAESVPESFPDVALVDIHMPRMDGITLIQRLQETYPSIATVILTTFEEDEYLFGGLRAGAKGYLLKDAEPEEVTDVLRRAARGESVLTGTVADRLIDTLRVSTVPSEPTPAPRTASTPLSEREQEVAYLISEGRSNQQIASKLFITEGTVRNHVTNTLRKLDLRDRTQLALWYRSWEEGGGA